MYTQTVGRLDRKGICYGMNKRHISLMSSSARADSTECKKGKKVPIQTIERIRESQSQMSQKRKTPGAPDPDSSRSPSSMRNLSPSDHHLIEGEGGGIHELMAWRINKTSIPHTHFLE
jgi:hypothetical protein